MTIHLGTVKPGSTIYIPFDTYAGATGASITMTGLAVTDIEIYRNGSVTQRASDTGYTLLDTDGIDFDGLTGLHGFSIDLSSNADAGFFIAGASYWVVVSSVTVDTQTVNFTAATFTIGYPDAILNTTIATLASQTSFTLTAGPAEDDALNGCEVIIHDIASAVQAGRAIVSDYTGSTRTVTLVTGVTFTAAAGDNISVFLSALQPTAQGRTLDVSAGGEAGVDWANVGTPGSTVGLTATTLATVTTTTTATNVTTVNGLAANVITAASIATGAIDADAIADNAIDAGAIATGAITAAKFAAGAIDAAAIAADAIGASELAADAATEIGTAVWATAARTLTAATNVTSTGAAVPITAGGLVSADVTAISTDATAADNAESFFDGTGYAGTNNVIPTVTTVTTTTNLTNERGKYALAAVWIGPVTNTNTVSYVDGIITNPVSTLAAASTIATALGLRRFYTTRTGTIQLGADYTGYDFDGDGWSLTTTGGSRDVSTSSFRNAAVVGGTFASITASSYWDTCEFSTGVTIAGANLYRCTFGGTLTLSAAGNYDFIDCASVVAGTSTPVFAVPAGTVNISFRRWSGGINITGITSSTTISIDMVSGGTVTLAGADGNVQVRGMVAGITDNRTGTPTLGQNAAINMTKINTEADTALSDYDPPTNTEMEARTLVAAGYATPTNITAGTITTTTNLTNLPAITSNWLTAAGLAADAVTEIQTGLSTLDAAGVRTAVGLASANLDTQLGDLPTAAENADAVWDEAIAGHSSAGSTGLALANATAPTAAAVADAVWDEAISGHLSAGSTGEALNAAGAAGDPWTTNLPGAYGAGSAGNILGNRLVGTIATGTHNPQSGDAYARLGAPAGASVSADILAVDNLVDDLESRLGTPSNLGGGATIAANLVDIEAQTDDIGAAGAGLTALGDTRIANLDATISSRASQTSVDDLPTNTELAVSQAAADDATLAAIAALNNLSSAQAQAAAAAALTAYDPPTNAEMEARTLSAANYATAAALATIDDLLDTEVTAILEDTSTTIPAQITALNNLSAAQVNAEVVDVLRTDLIPDSYAADGAQPTIVQAILAIQQFLMEKQVNSTTVTVRKPDGSTGAFTLTLDSATTPTSITRAT